MPPTKRTLPTKAQPVSNTEEPEETSDETSEETPETVPSNARDASAPDLDYAGLMERIRVLEEQAKKAQAAQSVASDDPYEAAVINLRAWAEAKRNARPDVDFTPLLKELSVKDSSGEYVNKLNDSEQFRELIAELLEDNSGKELESVKPLLRNLRDAERN